MKGRHLLMCVALVASASLAIFGHTEATDISEPAIRAPRQAQSEPPARGGSAAFAQPPILRLQPRDVRSGPSAGASDSGDEAFAPKNWAPAAPPVAVLPPAPPAPPTAPTLPFTCIGKAVEGGKWVVFLARGDRIYAVGEQDVVDDSYRVESISPPNITLTYLPLGQAQQLDIGGFE